LPADVLLSPVFSNLIQAIQSLIQHFLRLIIHYIISMIRQNDFVIDITKSPVLIVFYGEFLM